MHMQKDETTVDHQIFDAMYREKYGEVYKFIRHRIKDRELAQDVLQETFYTAYNKWDVVRDHENQTGWLINTAKNKIRELHKKLKKVECEVALETEDYVVYEDGYEQTELNMMIMKNLTEEEKRRFIRYFIHGTPLAEMAKLENVSENNMSVRISRLRDKIAQNISDELVFDKKQKKFVRNDKKSPYT